MNRLRDGFFYASSAHAINDAQTNTQCIKLDFDRSLTLNATERMLSYEQLCSLQANEINFHFAIIFPGNKSESQYFLEGELFQA